VTARIIRTEGLLPQSQYPLVEGGRLHVRAGCLVKDSEIGDKRGHACMIGPQVALRSGKRPLAGSMAGPRFPPAANDDDSMAKVSTLLQGVCRS